VFYLQRYIFQIKRAGFTIQEVELCCTSNVLYTQHTTQSGGQQTKHGLRNSFTSQNLVSQWICTIYATEISKNIHAKVQDKVKLKIRCRHESFTWRKFPYHSSQIHLSFHHHSYRDNVTAPTGRPNLRSRLHFSHSRGGETTKSERACSGIGGGEFPYHWGLLCRNGLISWRFLRLLSPSDISIIRRAPRK